MSRGPSLVADLVALTKPRIISLLLVTTIAPMFITQAGMPSLALIGWVTLGGYLMAGGANTINMWFDRDIDDLMARTRLRPIPSGRLPASAALLFGVVLGALAFAIFWFKVNPLSAWLALSGLLFYVLVYTMWLKRSSPQNIRDRWCGGRISAFGGLGRHDRHARPRRVVPLRDHLLLDTAPFLALALNKQVDYGTAGVPMMPNVHGVPETKRQMLLYTLMLVPLTIMPAIIGVSGLFYGVAASLLGLRFLHLCWIIARESGVTPTTWKLYKYSLSYLALLFVAMAVDRWVPFGQPVPAPERHVILENPGIAVDHGAH